MNINNPSMQDLEDAITEKNLKRRCLLEGFRQSTRRSILQSNGGIGMKVNAPEKLYVDAQDNFSNSMLYGFTEKSGDEDIEYVRKDAFIEKAEKYLLEHLIDYWSQVVTDESGFIEGFKQFMKGE